MTAARLLLRQLIGASPDTIPAYAPLWHCDRCEVRWRGDSRCWNCERRDRSVRRSTHGPKG